MKKIICIILICSVIICISAKEFVHKPYRYWDDKVKKSNEFIEKHNNSSQRLATGMAGAFMYSMVGLSAVYLLFITHTGFEDLNIFLIMLLGIPWAVTVIGSAVFWKMQRDAIKYTKSMSRKKFNAIKSAILRDRIFEYYSGACLASFLITSAAGFFFGLEYGFKKAVLEPSGCAAGF